MKRTLTNALTGASLAVLLLTAADSISYHLGVPPPSERAVTRPLGEFKVDPSWILSGDPVFRATETARSPDGNTVSGLWDCEGPTSFVWHFGQDETVHLLEGYVEVEYQGRRFAIQPGDTASFHAGTQAVWHVPQYAKKSFTLQYPGRLVRAWRKLAART
jgi:uncharacterized cupin superfamily protein